MKNIIKDIILLLILIIAGVIAFIEGTISLLSWGIIKTRIGSKIGRWSKRLY